MTLSFRYRFEAAHRFVFSQSPNCQTPHGHSWHATVKVRSQNTSLDSNQMVVEFQKLKQDWKKFIKEELDHSFFYNNSDPVVPHMKEHIKNFRGFELPSDPTTELLAVLFLRKAQILIKHPDILVEALLLEETVVNSIEVSIHDPIFSQSPFLDDSAQWENAWWNSPNRKDREISP